MTGGRPLASLMRTATISSLALMENLEALRALHGPGAVLDLRGNAYGLGAREVAHFAKKAGVSKVYLGAGNQTDPKPATADDGSILGGWWSGPGGDIVEFSADVVSVKRVPSGSAVSYGYHYTTEAETTLVLVAAGYADGVPRTASQDARVEIGGTLLPIAGRIAMDQFVLDAGDTPVEIGDRAVIWGQPGSLGRWSEWSGRPAGALLSHLGSRVVKTWL